MQAPAHVAELDARSCTVDVARAKVKTLGEIDEPPEWADRVIQTLADLEVTHREVQRLQDACTGGTGKFCEVTQLAG